MKLWCHSTVKLALTFFKCNNKCFIVPRQKLVFYFKAEASSRAIRIAFILLYKLLDINYPAHGIWADRFLDITVVKLKCYWFTIIIISTYFIYHRIMCMYVFPQSKLCFPVKIYHFFYVHYV